MPFNMDSKACWPLSLMVLLLAAWQMTVEATKHGAPWGACETMMPVHGNATPTEGNPGYTFSHDMCQGYQAGVTYTIIIRGPSFKGFFCRLQKRGTTRYSHAVGKWDSRHYPIHTRSSSCAPPSSGVTHQNVKSWTELRYKWIAPDSDLGTIQITCTIVKELTVFYPTLRSEDIRFNSATASISCPLSTAKNAIPNGPPPTPVVPSPPTSIITTPASVAQGALGDSTTPCDVTQTCTTAPPGPKGNSSEAGCPAGDCSAAAAVTHTSIGLSLAVLLLVTTLVL